MSRGAGSARNRTATTGCLVLLIGFIVFAMATCLMSGRGCNHTRREAESKNNLHDIHVAVEKYAEDHGGEYPLYLIGGEAKYSEVKLGTGRSAFVETSEIPAAQVSDPLLREGYLDAYPRNPFIRTGITLHQDQAQLHSARDGHDPLRNGTEEGKLLGTRFGSQCKTMGSVLADPRFTERRVTAEDNPKQINLPTYADIEYEMWDTWIGNDPYPGHMPGQFFYKSHGDVSILEWVNLRPSSGDTIHPLSVGGKQPTAPDSATGYIAGVYGWVRTKGLDVLGEERPVHCLYTDPDGDPEVRQPAALWLWTRSEISDDPMAIGGSPFSPGSGSHPNYEAIEMHNGNTNGIRDGIISVLSTREEFIGDEFAGQTYFELD